MEILNKIGEKEIRDLSKEKNEPEFILAKRLDAFNEFTKSEMPNFRYGLNIKLNQDFNLNELELDSGDSEINIKDDKKVIFTTFNALGDNEKNLIPDYFMKLANNENKFIALNTALFQQGILVYVPKNVKLRNPLILSTLQNSKTSIKHVLIIVEENSKLEFIDDISSNSDEKQYFSKVVEIFLKENAKLKYINLQNLSPLTYNFNYKKAKIERNAEFNFYDINFGSKLTYSDVIAILDGENSRFEHHGMFVGNEMQQFDLGVNAIHNAPYTYSNMLTKGALNNEAKAIYRGLIKISKDAHDSNGYQKEDTILLSDKAESDSIPKLEIENNEVKCTHGASVSQVDQEKLFYLMTRGLDEAQAKVELVKGFLESVLNQVKLDEIEKIDGIIESKIK